MAKSNSRESPIWQLEQLGYGEQYSHEISDMLETTDLLRGLTRPEIDLVSRFAHAYRAPKDTVILREGGQENYLFIVVQGEVEIRKELSHEGEMQKLAVVKRGKSVGEMSLIDGYPYSATAVASEESILVLLSRNTFERLADEYPKVLIQIVMNIANLMSLRLRRTSGALSDYLSNEEVG